MTIRQCPRCDLRFATGSELDAHLATDHDERPDAPVESTPGDRSPGKAHR